MSKKWRHGAGADWRLGADRSVSDRRLDPSGSTAVQAEPLGRRPTQADVARVAGVSQSLVSRVLNGSEVITVPAETRERVLAAIRELGYEPNSGARGLRKGRTFSVALVIPDITNPFYPELERGIQDVAEGHGFDVITYNTDGAIEKERKSLQLLRQGRVDGAVITTFHLGLEDFGPLVARGTPVVLLGRWPTEVNGQPIDSVYVDNVAAARIAVNRLIDAGHQRIGMLSGRPGTAMADERLRGYRDALAAAELPYDAGIVLQGDFAEEGGERGTEAMLDAVPQPSAIFAANDLMALGAMATLRRRGRRVPQDVAVVGFDDIPEARRVTPPLTTVSQFQKQLGQRAADFLLDRIEGATGPGRSEESPFQLIVRDSG